MPTRRATARGAAVLLKGGQFEAEFQVQSPAKKPPPPPGTAPPEPDTTSSYSGKGMFQTTNTKFKGA